MKRSAGRSRPPLSGFVLFIERPLGKQVGQALRDRGVEVILHSEVFDEDATDEQYLTRCSSAGWIPLTADSDVDNVPAQRMLIRAARLRVFRLTRNHWPWEEKVAAFVRAIPAMDRLLRRNRGPFIARIDRNGRIARVDDLIQGR